MPAKAIRLFQSPKILREFPPSQRYLIGVSGGRDSVALLHQLVALGYEKLVVCHLNHQLRGRSSDADARFVEQLARHLGLNFELGATDVRALALGKLDGFKPSSLTSGRSARKAGSRPRSEAAGRSQRKKISLETAAREARYAFFAKIARQKKCRTIFLGHHADDLVETFFINLFRGAGIAGLASMREISMRRIANINLTIVRPLLGAWRPQIDNYVRARRLTFREDASNRDLVPLRNRIRGRIIPYLEKTVGRNIRKSIWRAATIAADEEALMAGLARDGNAGGLSVTELRALPIAIQRRSILNWLRGREVSDVSFEVIERVRSLLDGVAKIAKVNLPRDRHVRRRAKKIFIEN